MKVRLIIHMHTDFSYDSNITPSQIISQCKQHNIHYIGITDHCTADGALTYKKMLEAAGINVLVGEELKTQSGEIIGLFITKNIECTKGRKTISLEQGIATVKKQGAIIIAPHPMDRMRNGIGKKNLIEFADRIDAIEVFNSRTKINYFNKRAEKYAQEHNLIQTIGPDAHIEEEIPNAIIEMENFTSPEEFLQNLKTATFYKKRLRLKNIIRPTMNKIKKKILGKNH